LSGEILQEFDPDFDDMYTRSVVGAQVWEIATYGNPPNSAKMSGYSSGQQENEDWLITPSFDLTVTSGDLNFSFDEAVNYEDSVSFYEKVMISTDYPGLGDPTLYTWTELIMPSRAAGMSWDFFPTGDLDITSYNIYSNVHIAFKYISTTYAAATWEVDNISIIEGTPPLVADFEADQTFVAPGTTVNFSDLTTGGATPYSYEWDFSYDGITFNVEETLSNPAWEFPTEGVFDIALRVTDFESTVVTEIKVAYITVAEVSEGVIINEVDADQDGTDAAEFVELYDGGVGNTSLDGLVIVLFNGSDDASYMSYDLDGYSTDVNGYFVIGSSLVPNVDYDLGPLTNIIQNGADAVALYTGDAVDFPNDTPVTTTYLIDAIVYDTNDSDDPGLLVLLNALEPQVNEGENGANITESNQRIPNGSGGARNTSTYAQSIPTPGAENQLVVEPDTPLNITISAVQNGVDADVTIGWDAVAGATSYTVYRTDDPNATFPDDWTAETGISGTSWSYTSHSPIRFYVVTANN